MALSKQASLKVKYVGFSLMLIIPALGPAGYYAELVWLSPVFIFIVVPVLDLILGDDKTDSSMNVLLGRNWDIYLYMVPIVYVLAWVGALIWAAQLVATQPLSSAQYSGVIVATGLSSAFATCAAHELLHRRSVFDNLLSRITMVICCYGHFVVEHLHHHRTVGISESGTLPHRGESLYAFVLRNMRFSFGNSYLVEDARTKAGNLPIWSNKVVQQHIFSFCVAAVFAFVWGWHGLGIFICQALIAMIVVEVIQYFEHYGLRRQPGSHISLRESWNCNGWLTNAITLNITRHSHHHTNIKVPYQHLNLLRGAPTMPVGYFALTWLAIVPALWRKVIDRRIPH